MAELLLGLLILLVFVFLIRYIINEKPEGRWDDPLLAEENESQPVQAPSAETPADIEDGKLDVGTGSST